MCRVCVFEFLFSEWPSLFLLERECKLIRRDISSVIITDDKRILFWLRYTIGEILFEIRYRVVPLEAAPRIHEGT